jgi:CPA2 family monovalent cation:H+ antiporter-2
MLFNPAHVLHAPVQILVTTAIVLIAKPLAAFVIVILLGYGARIGLRVAVALGQIGEFSFILAALGDQLHVLPPGATDSLIAASIISITLNPLLYRLSPAVESALMRSPLLRRALAPRIASQEPAGPAMADSQPPRAIVVGYGPVGQTVSSLLRKRGIEVLVIELNLETVQRLNSEGTRAVYGDAMLSDVLGEAGISTARGLILSSPASAESVELIRAARTMNGGLRVLVRCAFLSQAQSMLQAGADQVFSGEAEVAMAMTEYILNDLGATPDQLDQERQRVRAELYG